MNNFLIVFRGITHKVGYEKLSKSQKKFLIRESASQYGMITIDMIEKKSYRFAYHPDNGWIVVNDKKMIDEIKSIMEKITFSNKNFILRIETLIEKITDLFGICMDDILLPTEFEASPNYAYSLIHENKIEELSKMYCPITSEKLLNSTDIGILNGRFYKYDAILEWIKQTGRDPFTRQIVNIKDIRKSHLFKNY